MTDIAFKEYFERCINDLDKRIDQRLIDLDRRTTQHFVLLDTALNKAEGATDKRLTGMNEIRGAMSDLARSKASQEALENLSSIVQELRREKANLDGRIIIVTICGSVLINWAFQHFLK